MNISFRRIITTIPLISIIACSNFSDFVYDSKNPYRKEGLLEDFISAELYLIRTGDKSFDLRKNNEPFFSYIGYDFSRCGSGMVTYYRKELSIENFLEYVPKIVNNMKDSLFYRNFLNYQKSENDVYPFNDNPIRLITFINKEQDNVKLLKSTSDYICVSIKY